ncbi:hypothetical protein [Brevundimonas subvibrioides]|uniref:Uncharacterized protein n=1 Tax=Brevundimonas subvibrioides (strain ATCC 15264 / DSM 4735 / LMG 14903 / NBRC 16000 / CB 81) TaxID=633149 RepID=D9QF60_BRESC|nr:hypothetical protein [Brevundimonas subvibrioides]ADL00545.1 hypothetical protein Bresu_1233 [Brevundimonas subvibrioides ATCC 15264]
MLTLTCLLIVAVGVGLAGWDLDARFRLRRKLKKWWHRRARRQRPARAQHRRKIEARLPD